MYEFDLDCCWSIFIQHILLLFLLLLKLAAQAQVGKTKLFRNSFRDPKITFAMENWRKYNSGIQSTVNCTLESIQLSGVEHSVTKGHSTFQPL